MTTPANKALKGFGYSIVGTTAKPINPTLLALAAGRFAKPRDLTAKVEYNGTKGTVNLVFETKSNRFNMGLMTELLEFAQGVAIKYHAYGLVSVQ